MESDLSWPEVSSRDTQVTSSDRKCPNTVSEWLYTQASGAFELQQGCNSRRAQSHDEKLRHVAVSDLM